MHYLREHCVATNPAGDKSLPSTAWHDEFQDVNNDGLIDLYVAKGNVNEMAENAMVDAGFHEIDSLLLLQLDLVESDVPSRRVTGIAGRGPTRRLTAARLADAAAVDQAAFGTGWSNDTASLDAIREATPSHRSRMIGDGGDLRGFAISGRAGTRGYVQRVAVDPDFQRRGLGRLLVSDALTWMGRHHVRTVLVNTASDNAAALA